MEKFKKILKPLNAIEKMELKDYLVKNISSIISMPSDCAKIIEDNITTRTCPNCGNIMCKNGHTHNGTQKYICKTCGETITSTTNTVTYCSKKPFSIWEKVIGLTLDNLSIRKIAKRLELSTQTVFNMRHKIFEATARFLDKQKLKEVIQGDEEYKSINLKGTKKDNMPRISKKRKSSGLSGISHHKVCITTMFDSYDHLRMRIAGLGPATTKMIDDTMGDFVVKGSLLITDSKSSYIEFCKKKDLQLEQIPSGAHNTENYNNIQELNGIHSQLNTWLAKFNGVSTRHLQGYLDWFSYIFMLSKMYEEEDLKIEIYKDIIINSKYIKTTEICKKDIPVDLAIAYEEYHYGIFA